MSKFQIGRTLSGSFETASRLRQGDSLSTLLFNFTLEKNRMQHNSEFQR